MKKEKLTLVKPNEEPQAEAADSIETILENCKKDSAVFSKMVLDENLDSEIYHQLCLHYCQEMRKAEDGRICTAERMAVLYPIFREINIEMDEINAYWAEERRKYQLSQERKAKREAKKLAKAGCDSALKAVA